MKSTRNIYGHRAWTIAAAIVSTCAWLGVSGTTVMAGEIKDPPRFTSPKDYSSVKDWNLKADNLVPRGHNPLYFPLKPGFKFIMERPDHPDGYYRKEVIVLDKTEPFNIPGIGKFEAGVVQEEEYFDGIWTQHALNWFAIDKTTNSIYAFGEVSWEFEEGNKVFEGTWRAGEPDGNGVAEAGLLMPGTFNLGARYIEDGSESESLAGMENMETGVTVSTPAGTFENCVRVREYSFTDPDDITDKWWCPGVGIAMDTSDGKLVASDALPHTDTSSFGKYHRNPVKRVEPPVAKINGLQATEIALKEVPGKATSVSIERKRKRNVYVVEILAKADGVETDVFVDIESGEVVGTDR